MSGARSRETSDTAESIRGGQVTKSERSSLSGRIRLVDTNVLAGLPGRSHLLYYIVA